MIENGFVLTETEAREKMIKPRIINRMSKRVIIYPQVPCEEEYLVRCRKEASNMLLGVGKVLVYIYTDLRCACYLYARIYSRTRQREYLKQNWKDIALSKNKINV